MLISEQDFGRLEGKVDMVLINQTGHSEMLGSVNKKVNRHGKWIAAIGGGATTAFVFIAYILKSNWYKLFGNS